MRRPADTPATHQRSRGGAALRFTHARGGTRLADLHQAAPMRILFPASEPGEAPLAALVNTAGGLAGGDEVRVDVALDAGAHALVSTPAAEKIYRSLGPQTRVATRLDLAPGATLEWIPQETILFDGARLERRIEARIAPGARLLMAEMLVFGRHARGEALRTGSVFDSWRLHRAGRLLWADALALDGSLRDSLDNPFGFAGAEAMATLLLAQDAPLEPLREALREGLGAAVTLARPGLLLVRWLGGAVALRDSLGAAIRLARSQAFGCAPVLPRLWTC